MSSSRTPARQARLPRRPGTFRKILCNYSKAIPYLQAAWETTRAYPSGPGKETADFALAHLARLLLALGRTEQLQVLLTDAQGRYLDQGPLEQHFIRTREALAMQRRTPSASYRCGWKVINQYAQTVRGAGLPLQSQEHLYRDGNLLSGCSLRAMLDLAQAEGLSLLAVEWPLDAQNLPLPAVVHLKQNHYPPICPLAPSWITPPP